MRYVSAFRWMVPNSTCPTASAFGDRPCRGLLRVADDRRRAQPDFGERSEPGDDRVCDSNTEILILAIRPPTIRSGRTASWTGAAGAGETRGAAGFWRNSAAPSVSRTVRRTSARPRGVPRSACGTNPTGARSASYRQCASAHRGDRSRMATDHQGFFRHRPMVPSTPSGSDATSSSSGVGSSAMMAVIRLAPLRLSNASSH